MSKTLTVNTLTDAEFERRKKDLLPVRVPLEQSPTWGVFDDTNKDRTYLGSFEYRDKGMLVAVASFTLYQQKHRDWIWCKHGPLFATVPNTESVQKMCATLREQFSSVKTKDAVVNPVFIRMNVPTKTQPLALPFEHTMYDQTVVVDLTLSEDDILAGMSQSGRRGIRSAEKTDVVVREATHDRTAFFKKQCYPILRETGARDGFGIHPLSVYTNMLTSLKDESRLYVAESSGEVLAWAITTEYNQLAMYYYGGSSTKARESFAAYALHWQIIKVMKARGNLSYDFMGIAGKNYEGLKNVTQFKIKFSKNIVDIPFTYDLPLKPLAYKLLSSAIKLKRALK